MIREHEKGDRDSIAEGSLVRHTRPHHLRRAAWQDGLEAAALPWNAADRHVALAKQHELDQVEDEVRRQQPIQLKEAAENYGKVYGGAKLAPPCGGQVRSGRTARKLT